MKPPICKDNSKCSKTDCQGRPDSICKSCGFLICPKCISDHSEKCPSQRFIPVKYSSKEENLMAHCHTHDCYCNLFCLDCQTPICMYCKEWTHNRDHSTVSIVDYGKKFEEPLRNCINDAQNAKTTHNRIKKDIAGSHKNDIADILNHLEVAKNKVLAKLLYIFENAENQVKKQFAESCKEFQKVNNDILYKYRNIARSADMLANGSNIEKIIKTRTLIDALNDIPNVDETEIHQNKFRVEINSKLKDELLDECLTKIVADGIGTVQVSFKTDCWMYRPITSNFEDIIRSSEFHELSDPEKCKTYLNKNFICKGKFQNVNLSLNYI